MSKKISPQERLVQSMQKYIAENNKILKKYKLTSRIVVVFPKGKPPLIGKIAMWAMQKCGARFDTQFARIK